MSPRALCLPNAHLADVGKAEIINVADPSNPILKPQEADNGAQCFFAGTIPLEVAIPSIGSDGIAVAGR